MISMKRRVIKQGHNTLTLTLPTDWVKLFNIKPGDEVDVSKRESGLFISTEKNNEELKATLDIREMNIPVIWKYFMAYYREGYDEIKVIFDPGTLYPTPFRFYSKYLSHQAQPPKYSAFDTIRAITSRFIGLEIIENSKDCCIIRDMGAPSTKEFDSSLRRIFLLIQQMAEDSIKALNEKNSDYPKSIQDTDITIDKLHDYCIRVLNKTNFKEIKKAHIIFSMLNLLELVGDEFKHIADQLTTIEFKDRDLSKVSPIAEKMVSQINKFYQLYYKFNFQIAVDMSREDMEMLFFASPTENKQAKFNTYELEILGHYRRIGRYLNSLTELRVEMEA